jgi:membrane protein implicated in regulation of membrane protease activity
MNIYQHLLFLIPIIYLLRFGVVRIVTMEKAPVSAAIATATGALLFLVYSGLNIDLLFRLLKCP